MLTEDTFDYVRHGEVLEYFAVTRQAEQPKRGLHCRSIGITRLRFRTAHPGIRLCKACDDSVDRARAPARQREGDGHGFTHDLVEIDVAAVGYQVQVEPERP